MIWPLLIASLSYWAIMILTYAIFYGFTKHLFAKYKNYYELSLGIVFGIVSLIITIATLKILEEFEIPKNPISLYLPIITFWIVFYTVSPLSTFFILAINLIVLFLLPNYFVLFLKPTNNLQLSIITLSYIFPFIILAITFFVKKFKDNNFIFLIINNSVVLLMAIIFLIPGIDTGYKIEDIIVVFWMLALCYITYGVAMIINQIHSHAITLKKITLFDNEYYIINAHTNFEILNFIQKNKIQYGLYINFFIANYKKMEEKIYSTLTESIIDSITEDVHRVFSEEYKNSILFFKKNYKVFGMFIGLEKITENDIKNSNEGNNLENRNTNDLLFNISELFKKINTNFKYDKFFIRLKIKSIASIFGIHSNNLDTLYEINNHYIVNESKLINLNNILLSNPLGVHDEMRQTRKILSLAEIVPINQNTSIYENVYGYQENNIIGYWVNNIIDGNYIDGKSFDKYKKQINQSGLSSLLTRFLAFENLKNIHQFINQIETKKIFIKYDVQFLSSKDFLISEFLQKIKSTKVNKKNIVLVFDGKKEVQDLKLFEKNIYELKKVGISIGINVEWNQEFDLKTLIIFKPDYIFLYGDSLKKIINNKEQQKLLKEFTFIAKKIESKLICQNINSYLLYKNLLSIGINNFHGELIKTSNKIDVELSNELKILLNK